MAALAVEPMFLRCHRCRQAIARWNAATDSWDSLGAPITRRYTDRNRVSLICPVCGALKRIPDEPYDRDGDAA